MLHFEVQNKQGQRADYAQSVMSPSRYPCYVLVHNYDWNDYDYYTWFCLFYFKDKSSEIQKIGEFKLMCKGEEDTKKALPDAFDGELDERFCSLGINTGYYHGLKEVVTDKDEMHELLRSLRDCTYLPNVYEDFENEPGFKDSLLRDMESFETLNEGPKIYEGEDLDKIYSFTYRFYPAYEESHQLYTDWDVKFKYNLPSFLRTKGLIGENGVGKTNLLSNLVKDILEKNTNAISNIPSFGSILVLCSTPLDKYPMPDSQNPYYTCRSVEQDFRYTAEGLIEAIDNLHGRPTLSGQSLLDIWHTLVSDFFGKDFTERILSLDMDKEGSLKLQINHEELEAMIGYMSSGELHILTLITYLCSHIHLKSLIIVDEPEVHLHPHYIMEFMSVLCEFLRKFKSYAIIATHSPLVVREMVNWNVFRLSRLEGAMPHIASTPFATFGEDVSMLYRRIFNFDERVSIFNKTVYQLVENGKDYNSIVSAFEESATLSTEARMIIRDITEEKKNE